MKYTIAFSKQAVKDKILIKNAGYEKKTRALLHQLMEDPRCPPLDALSGNLKGLYSKRINIKHRIVYQIIEEEKIVKVLRMWSHYDKI